MSDSNSITVTVLPAIGDGTYKRCIYKAAATGDWKKASLYNKMNPNWTNTSLTMDKDTALHIAVKMEKIKFVTKLVQHISKKDMEIRTADGNTAFCLAAISGNVKIAKILFEKNPNLIWIKGYEEKLPIELAFLAGQFHMVKFLFERIEDDMHNNNNNINNINLPFKDIIKLFFLTLSSHNYGGAWSLLVKIPELGRTENENGLTALQLLAQSSFEKKAPRYKDLISLLFDGIEEEEDEFLQYKKTSKIMFDAAQVGNTLILEYIFIYDPNMFMEVNNEGQSILHIAILNRQESVYDLILSKGSYKNVLVQIVDRRGNNVLHLAGKLIASEGRLGSPQLHQDLICKEEKWFKEVEKIIPPILKTKKNKDDMIPEEIFYREHKGSSEKAVIEVNKTADTCLVVISFIMTLGITGALSIQNNKISENTHFLNSNKWFKVFILSIGCGVSLCATSMFLQNSIVLPSTWTKKHGYVTTRLSRMTLGYLSLYSAFPNIFMLSIFAGAVLIYSFFPTWVFYAIDVFNAIPFVLYIILFCYPISIYVGSKLASYHKVLLQLCQSR